jgi:hypothetical protein
MTNQDLVIQAEKLFDFVRRGGTIGAWFSSKDFDKLDKVEIMMLFQQLRRGERVAI